MFDGLQDLTLKTFMEASETGADLAAPQHLLLGPVRVGQGVAVRVLPGLSVRPAGIRREVLRMLHGEGPGVGGT